MVKRNFSLVKRNFNDLPPELIKHINNYTTTPSLLLTSKSLLKLVKDSKYQRDLSEQLLEASLRGHYDHVISLLNLTKKIPELKNCIKNLQIKCYKNACQSSSIKLIELFLDILKNNRQNSQSLYKTGITEACKINDYSKFLKVINFFLEKNITGWMSLAWFEGLKEASKIGNIQSINYILHELLSRPNHIPNYLLAGLAGAAEGNHLNIINMLLEYNQQLEIQQPLDFSWVFLHACSGGHLNMVQYCIRQLNNVIPQHFWNRSLINACLTDNLQLVLFLVNLYGPNFDYDWDACLYIAAKHGRLNIINYIVSNDDANFETGISGACAGNHLDIIELMLSLGAEYNLESIDIFFNEACKEGFLKLANMMLLVKKTIQGGSSTRASQNREKMQRLL